MANHAERLWYAIDCDDVITLQHLIEEGVDVQTVYKSADYEVTECLWFALHLCCEKGRYQCAKLLLEAGANPNVRDRHYFTSLMYAVSGEWVEIVQLLVDHECNLNHQDNQGRSAMHFAAQCSDTSCLEILIRAGADLNLLDRCFRTPLRRAVTLKWTLPHIEMLLAADCDNNLTDGRFQRSPLQVAIAQNLEGNSNCVDLLLESHCDVNTIDIFYQTPMMNLIKRNWSDAEHVKHEDITIARKLIMAGHDLNTVSKGTNYNQYARTALMMATERGAVPYVKLFLDSGAGPDVVDDLGRTPLHVAALHNREDIAAALIFHNCNLDLVARIKFGSGQQHEIPASPLYSALMNENWSLATTFVRCGCNFENEYFLRPEAVREPPNSSSAILPETLLSHEDFWYWLVEEASTPATLKSQSRKLVRTILGYDIKKKVDMLVLPKQLKNIILLNDVLGKVDV